MALYTFIVSPIPSFRSNTATGLINPVLEALHSIFLRVVITVSSFHLKAIPFLGYLAVTPKLRPYAVSSNVKTSPSDGIS